MDPRSLYTANLYGLARAQVAVADGAPFAEIQNPAGSTLVLGVTLIEVELTTAVGTEISLIPSLAIGVDGGGAGTFTPLPIRAATGTLPKGRLLTGWATSVPTYDATPVYLKRYLSPATVGNRAIWTFPEDNPLRIAANRSYVIRNFPGGGVSAATLINVVWKEFSAAV